MQDSRDISSVSEEKVRRMLGMSGKQIRIRAKWQGEEEEGQLTTMAEIKALSPVKSLLVLPTPGDTTDTRSSI